MSASRPQSPPSFPYFVVNEDNHAIIRGETTFYEVLRDNNRRHRKLLFGAALILCIVVGGWYLFLYNQTLDAHGQTVLGEIVARQVFEDAVTPQSNSYFLQFAYTVDGDDLTTWQMVNATTFQRYQVGHRATVVYLPDTPYIAQIRGVYSVNALPILCLFSVGLGMLLLITLHQSTQARRAKNTQLLQGEITGADQRMDTQRKMYLQLKYRFITPEGEVSEQAHILHGEKWLRDIPPRGAPVFIRYENVRDFQLM